MIAIATLGMALSCSATPWRLDYARHVASGNKAEEFMAERSRILSYLEPQYQGIVCSEVALNMFDKQHKKAHRMFSLEPKQEWRNHEDMVEAETALRKLNQIVRAYDWYLYRNAFKIAAEDLDKQFSLIRASHRELYVYDTLNQPGCDLDMAVSTGPPEEPINWNVDEPNVGAGDQWDVEGSNG
ncbi:uncharacterized protein PAC_11696 [Phialocephala subalpina]|uniref:Uncharacterized protein n=1 Tax=Phialocephala subalpina TaxID=576137 RepID=A0A1L7X9V4_9HELO|nr:uncharacterized protein PAC_11696 [Phialocephala subalpina]